MPNTYHIWTVGCQMNTADSERMGAALEQMGMEERSTPKDADVVLLNSCVVRQNAEDRVVGMLTSLKPWRESNPGGTLALMGCMVGPRQDELKDRFPYVDVFMRPQDFEPLLRHLGNQTGVDIDGCLGPMVPVRPQITAHVPIIHGCNKFCTFCIIPYRRGREVSRSIDELVWECQKLSERGVQEVTLLGQNVDSYGQDLPGQTDLADLMEAIHDQVPALKRIRFLTSHPSDMSDRIVDAIANLPRVMETINLPFQAGDDSVLENMRRGYTNSEYRELIDSIRSKIPGAAITTDLIVGFPGETDKQFQKSLDMIRDIRFHKVHVAAYSQRPGTIAARTLVDNIPLEEKRQRLKSIESIQEKIVNDLGQRYVDSVQEVLVDGHHKGKWRGRTRTDRLVFFEDSRHLVGELATVQITSSSAWSMQAQVILTEVPSL